MRNGNLPPFDFFEAEIGERMRRRERERERKKVKSRRMRGAPEPENFVN